MVDIDPVHSLLRTKKKEKEEKKMMREMRSKMEQENKLWDEIVKHYGTSCEPFKEEILFRLDALIASTLYADLYGIGNALYTLNNAFEEVKLSIE